MSAHAYVYKYIRQPLFEKLFSILDDIPW